MPTNRRPEAIGRRLVESSVALIALLLPAGSGDRDVRSIAGVQRAFEMPAHRLLLRQIDQSGHNPAPFATDGCSGGLSRAWELISSLSPDFAAVHQDLPPWEACCLAHDRAYHVAGEAASAEASYAARLAADETLRACVIDTGAKRGTVLGARYGLTDTQVAHAYTAIAAAMFDAVRLGGGPCSGLPWRWGYGYPGCLQPDDAPR